MKNGFNWEILYNTVKFLNNQYICVAVHSYHSVHYCGTLCTQVSFYTNSKGEFKLRSIQEVFTSGETTYSKHMWLLGVLGDISPKDRGRKFDPPSTKKVNLFYTTINSAGPGKLLLLKPFSLHFGSSLF